jgi:hypothetical protein
MAASILEEQFDQKHIFFFPKRQHKNEKLQDNIEKQ